MTDRIEDATRAQVASFLPAAIEKALASYHAFSDQDIPDDAKGFSAHHGACKVAIAHVELLLKLARWADIDSDSVGAANQLAAMLSTAEDEVRRYHDEEDVL
jgi:hypothetical protein